MVKKIYHGSKSLIEVPQYGCGKVYNDYGLGFYCTENIDMAKEWAVSAGQDGYANGYQLNLDNLKILNLNQETYCILHWLAILLENREFDMPSALALEAKEYIFERFSVDYKKYDVIMGYRADDSYFSFAQDFLNGTISYRQLTNAMYLGKLGEQIVLKSEKAFNAIQFMGAETAKEKEWYPKKMLRDTKARREYFDLERNRRQKGDIYVMQMIDEEMNADDPRLR